MDDLVLLFKLFRLLVLPVMMYGHENWGSSLLSLASAMDSPLEKVFRRFLRHVLGLRAGTPTAVLLTEAGQYPLRVDILTSFVVRPGSALYVKDKYLQVARNYRETQREEWP